MSKVINSGPYYFSEAATGAGSQKGETPARAESPFTRSVQSPLAILGQGYGGEVEPNGTPATATPIAGTNNVIRANILPTIAPAVPAPDLDVYSFPATAGDRVYAAVMTSAAAGSSTDSQLTLIGSDGAR